MPTTQIKELNFIKFCMSLSMKIVPFSTTITVIMKFSLLFLCMGVRVCVNIHVSKHNMLTVFFIIYLLLITIHACIKMFICLIRHFY